MRRHAIAMLALCVTAPAIGAQPMQPYEAVWSLRMTDDLMARGDRDAYAARARAAALASKALTAAHREAWQDWRNVRAALVWALAGGGSPIVDRLQRDGAAEGDFAAATALVAAILKPDLAKSRQLTVEIDFKGLEPGLAAAIALRLSDLPDPDLNDIVVPMLEAAVVAMPGTFFAEAAYRRLVAALFRQKIDGRAQRFLARYVEAFPSSLFAGRLIESLIDLAREAGGPASDRLADLLERALPAGAPGLSGVELLGAARVVLLDGQLRLAAVLAGFAEGRLAGGSGTELARLYKAAAVAPIGTEAPELSMAERARLGAPDRALLEAVIGLGELTRGTAGGQHAGGAPSVEETRERVRRALAESVSEAAQ